MSTNFECYEDTSLFTKMNRSFKSSIRGKHFHRYDKTPLVFNDYRLESNRDFFSIGNQGDNEINNLDYLVDNSLAQDFDSNIKGSIKKDSHKNGSVNNYMVNDFCQNEICQSPQLANTFQSARDNFSFNDRNYSNNVKMPVFSMNVECNSSVNNFIDSISLYGPNDIQLKVEACKKQLSEYTKDARAKINNTSSSEMFNKQLEALIRDKKATLLLYKISLHALNEWISQQREGFLDDDSVSMLEVMKSLLVEEYEYEVQTILKWKNLSDWFSSVRLREVQLYDAQNTLDKKFAETTSLDNKDEKVSDQEFLKLQVVKSYYTLHIDYRNYNNYLANAGKMMLLNTCSQHNKVFKNMDKTTKNVCNVFFQDLSAKFPEIMHKKVMQYRDMECVEESDSCNDLGQENSGDISLEEVGAEGVFDRKSLVKAQELVIKKEEDELIQHERNNSYRRKESDNQGKLHVSDHFMTSIDCGGIFSGAIIKSLSGKSSANLGFTNVNDSDHALTESNLKSEQLANSADTKITTAGNDPSLESKMPYSYNDATSERFDGISFSEAVFSNHSLSSPTNPRRNK